MLTWATHITSLLVIGLFGFLVIDYLNPARRGRWYEDPDQYMPRLGVRLSAEDLWNWQGTLGRGAYVCYGLILFVVMYNMQRFVAAQALGQPWSLFSDIERLHHFRWPAFLPVDTSGGWAATLGNTISQIPAWELYATLMAASLPFTWAFVMLTIRRLRDIRLPPALAASMLIPFANIILFLLLSLLPSARALQEARVPPGTPFAQRLQRLLDKIIPDHYLGCALMAVLMALPAAAGEVVADLSQLPSYGWGMFIGNPFSIGLFAVLLYGYHRPRKAVNALAVAGIAFAVLNVILLSLTPEGLIYLMMMAPIALMLSLLGGSLGFVLQRSRDRRRAER